MRKAKGGTQDKNLEAGLLITPHGTASEQDTISQLKKHSKGQ